MLTRRILGLKDLPGRSSIYRMVSSTTIKVTVTNSDKRRVSLDGEEGDNLMEIIKQQTDFPLEACCGGMAKCSTCHVYIDPKQLALVNEVCPCSEFELDVLDRCIDGEANSRLSCQVELKEDMQELDVVIPSTVKDLRFSR
ncbi:2Fe-2S iron-sulfur cluster binding domain containing protein, putative [Angomonas deanei]|uniref:2Fe-2S iron-sulfur cluster binding domain containing protein, putative n=1 Tax=Angomonas deanei TaxID=59799 RepID=A0A7G2C1J1_9TRYP|nr:2Fe-2S iron-sulfur cluster binding domain containing protein, putative [Angomonas deanei]